LYDSISPPEDGDNVCQLNAHISNYTVIETAIFELMGILLQKVLMFISVYTF